MDLSKIHDSHCEEHAQIAKQGGAFFACDEAISLFSAQQEIAASLRSSQ